MDKLTPIGFDHSNKEHLLQRELRLFETHFTMEAQGSAPVLTKSLVQEQSNATTEIA